MALVRPMRLHTVKKVIVSVIALIEARLAEKAGPKGRPWTLYRLAEVTGIERSHLYQARDGERALTDGEIEKVCHELEWPPGSAEHERLRAANEDLSLTLKREGARVTIMQVRILSLEEETARQKRLVHRLQADLGELREKAQRTEAERDKLREMIAGLEAERGHLVAVIGRLEIEVAKLRGNGAKDSG